MGAQLAAPRAALTLAMTAPPSAMETNERRKLVLKKRHRGPLVLTPGRAGRRECAHGTGSLGSLIRDSSSRIWQTTSHKKLFPVALPADGRVLNLGISEPGRIVIRKLIV